MPYLSILGLEFRKSIVMFEISTLKRLQNEVLTHTVNFCIESPYVKVQTRIFLKVQVRAKVRVIKYVVLC